MSLTESLLFTDLSDEKITYFTNLVVDDMLDFDVAVDISRLQDVRNRKVIASR